MDTGFYFLEIMLLILLAVVGALVIWLHFRLNSFTADRKKLPLLADSLANSMTQAYEGISRLEGAVKTYSPELEKKVSTAKGVLHELSYVLDRAERLMARLDVTFERVGNAPSPAVSGSVPVKAVDSVKMDNIPVDVKQKSKKIAEKLGESIDNIPLAGNKALYDTNSQPLRKASLQRGSQAYNDVANVRKSSSDVSDAEQELRQALVGRL